MSYFVKTFLFILFCAILEAKAQQAIPISDSLSLKQISPHCYIHISQHHVPGFGLVSSNGLLYINGNEALVMDTPPNETLAQQFLDWMKVNYPTTRIVGIVVNHFHSDCLGGLKSFHNASIASYSHQSTPRLLKEKNQPYDVPKNLFGKRLALKVGDGIVVNEYNGQAHAPDNIVSYVVEDKVLFGGCMVKALKASKGNTADANLAKWSNTVSRVRKKFKGATIIVPGHGKEGGQQLLDFTIDLFRQ